jgi:Septum formation
VHRWRLGTTAAVVLLVGGLLAACGNPPGTDGNLANNWKVMPDAVIPTPASQVCYDITTEDPATVTKWPTPVDCGAAHTVETAYVGTFTGAEAERSSPPTSGSPGRRAAFEQCAAEAKGFLGDDWRTGRLDLFLVLPIALHWQGGARWFRCDLLEYKDLNDYEVVKRTGSLKGGLSGERAVGLGCFTVVVNSNNQVDQMNAVACSAPHTAEFAGVYDLPDTPYPTDRAAAARARLDGCGPVVAAYAGVPNDSNLTYRIGWIAFGFSEVDWGLGNRGVRCYGNKANNITGSIKGIGPSGLPAD